jgi:hypothetical protein
MLVSTPLKFDQQPTTNGSYISLIAQTYKVVIPALIQQKALARTVPPPPHTLVIRHVPTIV